MNMRTIRSVAALLILACMLCVMLSACMDRPSEDESVFRDLTWAVGTVLPEAQDFAVSLPEGATVRFAEQYSYTSLGDYTLTLIVTDSRGRESRHSVRFSLVRDTEPPVIEGIGDRSIYLGDGISYRSGVTLRDNCDGAVSLTIDSSAENLTAEGSFPVVYIATDAAGNRTVVEITVWVYRESVTEAMLYNKVDRLIAEKINTKAPLRTQATQVYDFVHSHVLYGADSDKTDWVRAAYDGIRTGQGDCFTYFAISKAFFNRLGIESMDVRRIEGISIQRHYWNFVNIGTADAPIWYHFDACPIKGETARFGCLLTDSQVDAYTAARTMEENGRTVTHFFYAYDKSLYPASATEIINPH